MKRFLKVVGILLLAFNAGIAGAIVAVIAAWAVFSGFLWIVARLTGDQNVFLLMWLMIGIVPIVAIPGFFFGVCIGAAFLDRVTAGEPNPATAFPVQVEKAGCALAGSCPTKHGSR